MFLNDGLDAYGIDGAVDGYINTLIENLSDRLYSELIIPVFGYMPGLWALVEDEKYEEAKDFMLGNADPALINTIDEYHYNVQNRAYDILKAAEKNTNIYITAQYNMQG